MKGGERAPKEGQVLVNINPFIKAACGRFGFLKIFHNPAGQKNFHLTLALRIRDFCSDRLPFLLKISGIGAMGVVSIGFVVLDCRTTFA